MTGYYGGVEDKGGDSSERAAAYERWLVTILRPTLEDYRERREIINYLSWIVGYSF